MKTALVGYTGFVGGNLAATRPFDALYNSKNISEAFGTQPDLLLFAGLPAAKFLANTNPEGDWQVCQTAFENIKKISPKRLVLISTVDVYESPKDVNENTQPSLENPEAYGRNRAKLEVLVRNQYPDALIIRLPGLFGCGLKKNFLYDFLTITPSMLKAEKYEELAQKSQLVKGAYEIAENGFFALTQKAKTEDAKALREWFTNNDFNALYFTDSRASYQFYDLSNLWRDIAWALAANLDLLNLATEPVTASEIYEALTKGEEFKNEVATAPISYDMRTKYDALYNGEKGYMYSKKEILTAMQAYVATVRKMEDC